MNDTILETTPPRRRRPGPTILTVGMLCLAIAIAVTAMRGNPRAAEPPATAAPTPTQPSVPIAAPEPTSSADIPPQTAPPGGDASDPRLHAPGAPPDWGDAEAAARDAIAVYGSTDPALPAAARTRLTPPLYAAWHNALSATAVHGRTTVDQIWLSAPFADADNGQFAALCTFHPDDGGTDHLHRCAAALARQDNRWLLVGLRLDEFTPDDTGGS